MPRHCDLTMDHKLLKLSTEYNFAHVTRYPASNGEAEQIVRTVKGFLKKCDNPYLAPLTYRSIAL